MDNCLFCKIIGGQIPSSCVYEDEMCLAFRDINPMAPVHIIIVPKLHFACADDITESNSCYIAHIFEIIPMIAKQEGIADDGYRIINNCGKNAGQTVMHIHFHVLGGKPLQIELA